MKCSSASTAIRAVCRRAIDGIASDSERLAGRSGEEALPIRLNPARLPAGPRLATASLLRPPDHEVQRPLANRDRLEIALGGGRCRRHDPAQSRRSRPRRCRRDPRRRRRRSRSNGAPRASRPGRRGRSAPPERRPRAGGTRSVAGARVRGASRRREPSPRSGRSAVNTPEVGAETEVPRSERGSLRRRGRGRAGWEFTRRRRGQATSDDRRMATEIDACVDRTPRRRLLVVAVHVHDHVHRTAGAVLHPHRPGAVDRQSQGGVVGPGRAGEKLIVEVPIGIASPG